MRELGLFSPEKEAEGGFYPCMRISAHMISEYMWHITKSALSISGFLERHLSSSLLNMDKVKIKILQKLLHTVLFSWYHLKKHKPKNS